MRNFVFNINLLGYPFHSSDPKLEYPDIWKMGRRTTIYSDYLSQADSPNKFIGWGSHIYVQMLIEKLLIGVDLSF